MSALDPNRYAAPAEAALLRYHLAHDEAAKPAIQQRVVHAKTALHDARCALQLAQEAVDSAQAIHDEVVAIQDALDQRLLRTSGLLHPVRRVPDEVLSIIYLEWMYTERDDGSEPRPFHVGIFAAAVCRRWRRVALHLPALWRSIKLDLDLVSQERAAIWIDYITTFLARSSPTPIDLDITGLPETVESHLFWTILSNSFGKARSIDLVLSGTRTSHSLNRCFFQHAPFLEEFLLEYDLEQEQDSACHLEFFSSAPLLRTFSWQGPRLSWVLATSTYPSVTSARVFTTHVDAESLGGLFSRMPSIRTLTTMTRHLGANNTPTTFALNNNTLEDLHLLSDGLDADVMRRIAFPSLRQARVELPESELAPDAVTAILQHTMPGVQRLDLCVEAGLDLIPGLRSLSQLRCLTLMDYADSAVQFFNELAQPSVGSSWLCPQLEELHLSPGILPAPITQAILRVARARGQRAPVDARPPCPLISISFGSRMAIVGAQFLAELEEALGDSEGH